MYPEEVLDEPLFTPDLLEGEYTTWTLVWVHDFCPLNLAYWPLVDNYGTVYASDGPLGMWMHIIDYYGAAQVGLTEWVPHATDEMAFSANRKYVLTYDTVTNTIFRVWRRAANIFSRNIALDHPTFTQINEMAMSPNGKFIAITGDDAITGANCLLLLYEGA